jgi:hypothetical protein
MRLAAPRGTFPSVRRRAAKGEDRNGGFRRDVPVSEQCPSGGIWPNNTCHSRLRDFMEAGSTNARCCPNGIVRLQMAPPRRPPELASRAGDRADLRIASLAGATSL